MKHFSWLLWLSLVAALGGPTLFAQESLALFVSPRGSDAWSGRLPAPNKSDGPFKTVAAALRAARLERANAPQREIKILLRGGDYSLDKPIEITAPDSGANAAARLIIAAYPGEKPALSGGRRIRDWRRSAANPSLWEARVPEFNGRPLNFRALFVNGQRQQRARTPNQGFFRIAGASPEGHPARIHFRDSDIQPRWAEAGDVELIAFLAWADLRMPIRQVDPQEKVAILTGDPRPSNRESDARYYIENAADALDAPGEWRLDRAADVVRYWARAGEDPNQEEVIAPALPRLLEIHGQFDEKMAAHDITLRGLTFRCTNWELPKDGYADTQAAVAVRGDVLLEGARDCRIERCLFAGLSGYGIELGKGCQHIQVCGNEMRDLGGGGIRVGESEISSDPFEATFGNVIEDNEIHDVGRVYAPAVGVLILQSGGNRVAHNDIHHLYYTAISTGWTWGYRESPCHDNLIEFNQLHDIGQCMLSDMGAVYTLGIQPGTIVRNNVIHDVNSFAYGGWGLYTDEGSTGIVLENNVVYRCKSAGFHQHYGKDNIVRNNIFAFNAEHQLMRTRAEPHTSFAFTHNIVCYDSGDLLGSNWSNDHYEMDWNDYYDARLKNNPEAIRFAGASLQQWRQRGHDPHSIFADPLFVDAAAGNFQLRPDSPALKIGFHPIDLREVGVRGAAGLPRLP